MFTLTDIFTALSTKSKPPPSPAAVNAANAVATALLSRRLRSFYSHLASTQRTRATPALLLLAAIASFSPSTARELVRVFDFGLSALPQLARSLRPRKGETSEQAGIRQRQEWANSDPIKRPTRAAFTSLCQALLLSADAQLLPEILRLRPLLGGTLHHLSNDPPAVQLEMLKVVQKKVLASKVPLGPATKAELFSDATLGQLAAICAAGEDDIVEDSIENEENSIAKVRRQASDLSFAILHSVCTEASNGLCSSKEACLEFKTLESSAFAALNPGQRRLLRWLQRLKPAESSRQGELLRAAVAHDPALAAAMLLSLPYSMEPTATGKWLVHASIVGSLMQSVASAQVGLLELAERGLAPPELSARSMQAVLRCALPLALPRSALSRGVQHSNALVRHAVLCLLANMLGALHSLLEAVHEAQAAIPSSSLSTSGVSEQWKALESGIQQTARTCLPDLQPVLAQLSAVLNPSKNNNNNAAEGFSKKKGKAASSMEIEMDTINIVMPESDNDEKEEEKDAGKDILGEDDESGSAGKKAASLNTALFSATMHVLQRWKRCLPISFAESNVDVEKLVPEELATLPPLQQLQMLTLLLSDSKKAGEGGAGSYLGAGNAGSALLPVLKLLASCDEKKQPEVKAAASSWAVQRLTSTGLFEANPAEAFLWIDLIPVGSGVEAELLYNAIGLVLRKPAEFYSFLGASFEASSSSCVEMSLLVLCVLRQALRVLSSEKKSVEEKDAVARYTARVAALAVMQQREQKSSAAAASALLQVLLSEASRDTGAAGGNDKGTSASGQKRKASGDSSNSNSAAVHALLEGMGPPAEPLAALATWLEAAASLVINSDDKKDTKGKKKSKKAKKEAGQENNGAAPVGGRSSRDVLLPLSLFPALETTTAGAESSSQVLFRESVPLSQLSLAVFRLGQTESLTRSNEIEKKIFDYVISLLESDTTSQRASLVARQALYLLSSGGGHLGEERASAVAMLCAVLRGAIAATLKHHSFFSTQAASCVSLVCSSGTLLNSIESSEGVAVELLQWILEKVISSAATDKTSSSSSSMVLSLRPVVAKILSTASEIISKPENLKQPPSLAISKLFSLAVASSSTADGDSATSVLCSLLESISQHTKTIDIQWIDTAGTAIASLVSTTAAVDVDSVLEAGCRAVADLLAGQRSR